jgi:hypothetical protein
MTEIKLIESMPSAMVDVDGFIQRHRERLERQALAEYVVLFGANSMNMASARADQECWDKAVQDYLEKTNE